MKRKISILATVLVAGQLLTSCGILPTEEEFQAAPVVKEYEGMTYGKTAVTRGDLIATEEVILKYKGTESDEITAEDGNTIRKIYVKEGDRVTAGDLLIRYKLGNSDSKVEESSYKIKVMNLKIRQERELMQAEINKQKKLDNDKTQIKNIRQQHESTIDSYQTELRILKLELNQAKEKIENADTIANLDGKITFVEKNLVNTAPEPDVVMIKIEGAKRNRFEASSEYGSKFYDGQKVQVSMNGDRTVTGTIQHKKGSKNKIYVYPGSTSGLRNGDVGTIQCVLKEKKNVLYLPSAVVFTMGDKHIVYVENDKGMKTMKEVKVGITINQLTEIVSGVNEGDQVITN